MNDFEHGVIIVVLALAAVVIVWCLMMALFHIWDTIEAAWKHNKELRKLNDATFICWRCGAVVPNAEGINHKCDPRKIDR